MLFCAFSLFKFSSNCVSCVSVIRYVLSEAEHDNGIKDNANKEDNNKKCLITFLSYYSAALDQLSPDYADELKQRIDTSVRFSEYPFLNDIQDLGNVNASNPVMAQDQIQAIIDAIIQESVVRARPAPADEFIIEEDTDYSRDIQRVPCNFRSIKRLSDDRASGNGISGRGVQQIQTEDGLFDYMRNYGNMHQAKVKSALTFPFPQEFDKPVSLIDWGCGQGLASMVFMDKYGTANIRQIILIEPSEIALRRAALHCKRYAPDVPLQTICKEFDELRPDDIHLVEPETTVHLFSNVLDMESYSVEHLVCLVKSLPRVKQYCICISPYIDDIRTHKIDTFVRLMEQNDAEFNMLNSKTNTKYNEFWNCNKWLPDVQPNTEVTPIVEILPVNLAAIAGQEFSEFSRCNYHRITKDNR